MLIKRDNILGQDIKQFVLPQTRRTHVLELGHGVAGAHMAGRNMVNRIRLNFWWPTIPADTMKYCASGPFCEQRARVTCLDRVPIQPIPRAEVPFSHWVVDVSRPMYSEKSQRSYFVELDGARHNMRAKHLRRYTGRVEQAVYEPTAIGGAINNALNVKPAENSECQAKTQIFHVFTCTVIHDEDTDFGSMQMIRKAGIRWKMKKCYFALSEARFCGQQVGSCTPRVDPGKRMAIPDLQVPEKKRQMLGLFYYFRESIPNFAAIAKPLTDLTAKGIPNRVPWGD